MNKNDNIPGPFGKLPIFAEVMEGHEEIMRPLSIEDEMRLMYEKKMERELKERLEQGIEQGIEQGLSAGRREIAKIMRNDGEPVDKIIKYTGLSGEEIEQL